MTEIEPRPTPKALIWGLVGGFVLFLVILLFIVLGREKNDPAPAAPAPHASESRSESPPQ